MSTQGKSLQDEVEDVRRNKRKKENNKNKKEVVDKEKNKKVIKDNNKNLNEEDMKLHEEDEEDIVDNDSYTSKEGNEKTFQIKKKHSGLLYRT